MYAPPQLCQLDAPQLTVKRAVIRAPDRTTMQGRTTNGSGYMRAFSVDQDMKHASRSEIRSVHADQTTLSATHLLWMG